MSSDVCNNIEDLKILPISERPPVPGAVSHSDRPSEERCTDGKLRQTLSLKMASFSAAIEERENEPEGSDSVTPPYTRWAESLEALLSDSDGTALFRKFVTQENHQNPLLFYFAVEGFKKDRPSNERTELAKIIHRRFVKLSGESSVDISPEVRTKVADAIRNSKIGPDLFDQAQQEVELVIKETSYPLFLKSDLYVQYVSNGGISPESTESTSSSGSHLPHGYLPTLHEDSVLVDVLPKREDTKAPLPLTQETLLATSCQRSKMGKQQEGQFLRSRPRISPYHPNLSYNAFAPAASTNDSELQSLSSDAISDDTMSLTDSSVDGISTRRSQPKRRTNQAIKHNIRQNGKLKNAFPVMPMMQRPQKDPMVQSPEEFAKILIEKLKDLEREQIAEDKLNARLRKVEEEDMDMIKTVIPSSKDTEPLISVSGLHEEDPNSILDQHLLRVFDDSAKQSPSGHSPRSRSRSPEHAHQAKLSQMANVSQLPQTVSSHNRNHKSMQRQRTRDSGVHLTEIPVDTGLGHHHHHHRHYLLGKRNQDPMQYSSPGFIPYAKIYAMDSVGMSPYASEILVEPSKHKSKKSSKKSDVSSVTKTTDSGIYEGTPSLPSDGEVNPNKRVEDWLLRSTTSSKSGHKRGHRSSQDSHTSSSQKRASGHSSTRNSLSSQERTHTMSNYGGYTSSHKASHLPNQPFMQDPSMPLIPPPEARVVLEEARRIIDLSSKQKASMTSSSKKDRGPSSSATSTLTRSGQGGKMAPSSVEEELSSARAGKKSSSASSTSSGRQGASVGSSVTAEKEVTTVAYYLSPDPIPYRTTLPGKKITLRQFKSLIGKRGTYRYTFKMPSEEFESGVVHQIISDEEAILPLYEGKIVGKVEKVDCPETQM